MSIDLKRISPAAVPAALEKAERYRLLNEPALAESICRDVLAVDDKNHVARVTLLLSLTDQFDARSSQGVGPAEEQLAHLSDAHDRAYYAGIIAERWARALLASGDPGGQAYDWLWEAMARYEEAQTTAKPGNDEAILRYNTCVRVIAEKKLVARDEHHLHGD